LLDVNGDVIFTGQLALSGASSNADYAINLNVPTSGRGIQITGTETSSNDTIGLYNSLSASGIESDVFGVYNNLNNSGTTGMIDAKAYGIYNQITVGSIDQSTQVGYGEYSVLKAEDVGGSTVQYLYGNYLDIAPDSNNDEAYGIYLVNTSEQINPTSHNYGFYLSWPELSSSDSYNTKYSIFSTGAAESYFAGSIGIGNSIPEGMLSVQGAQVGQALAQFNEIGDQNILTASASGVTRLNLNHAGQLQLTTDGSSTGLAVGADQDLVLYHDGSNSVIDNNTGTISVISVSDINMKSDNDDDDFLYFSTDSNIFSLYWEGATGTNDPGIRVNGSGQMEYRDEDNESWTSIGSLDRPNYWQLNEGALSPISLTTDLNLGAVATSSAKISLAGSLTRGLALGIFNQTENQPIITASSSGSTRWTLDNDGSISQTALTSSGNAFSLAVNSLTSGSGFSLSSTSTSLTSGRLLSLDWSPDSATVATGDLFRINIGASGAVGNLFHITDDGSTIFSVSETKITSAVPHEFTSPGDVKIGYDLILTNQTSVQLESYGPLSIISGESFENNDLVLKTYGTGDVLIQSGGNLVLNDADPAIIMDTVTSGDTDYWMGILEDSGSDDDDIFVIGDGTTSGSNSFLSINTSGYVGIGTTNPSGAFVVGVGNTYPLYVSQTGYVGIATTAPLFTLHALSQQAATVSAMIENSNSGATTGGLAVKLGYTGVGSTTNSFITFLNGEGIIHGKIRGNAASGVEYQTSGIDFAEYFVKKPGEQFEVGDIVSMGTQGAMKSQYVYDPRTYGVVSSNPGFTGGTEGPDKVLVGLIGQVKVKISDSSDDFNAGEYITASAEVGKAMKAYSAGRIVGRALESWEKASGKKEVMIYVNPSWWDPDIMLTSSGDITITGGQSGDYSLKSQNGKKVDRIGQFAETVSARIRAGLVVAKSLSVEAITIDGLSLRDYILSVIRSDTYLVSPITSGYNSGSSLNNTASISGTLTVDKLIANSIQTDEIMTERLSIIEKLYQDITGNNKSVNEDDFQKTSEATNADSQDINSSPLSSVTDIINDIVVFLNEVVFKRLVRFAGDVIFEGRTVFSNETAGIVIIPKYAQAARVVFDKPYDEPPVITITLQLTNATDSAFLSDLTKAAVSDVTTAGFTVVLDEPTPVDAEYNWVAMAIKNKKRIVPKTSIFDVDNEFTTKTIESTIDINYSEKSTESAEYLSSDSAKLQ
jgi:hypothetical protein